MATTARGIWTPDDSDDWDLTVDLAATAVSVDAAIDDAVDTLPAIPVLPFETAFADSGNTVGTITATGSPGAFTGITAPSLSVAPTASCRAKITVTFKFAGNVVTTGGFITVNLSGATTLTPSISTSTGVQAASASTSSFDHTYSGSWIVDLNSGSTTFTVVGQASGAGGTRNIRAIYLIVEPVMEAP